LEGKTGLKNAQQPAPEDLLTKMPKGKIWTAVHIKFFLPDFHFISIGEISAKRASLTDLGRENRTEKCPPISARNVATPQKAPVILSIIY